MVQLTRPRQTERLTLRAFELTDLDDLAVIFADEGVNRYLYSSPRDRAATRETLERRVARAPEVEEDNHLCVAVVLRGLDRLIGDFMLGWHADEHRQGEIGGSLHPDFHGRGYAAEVYDVLLELAFVDYGLHRVVGRCDARNTASVRALEKAGLRQEAHFIENEFVKGEWTDEIILALRRSEWERARSAR